MSINPYHTIELSKPVKIFYKEKISDKAGEICSQLKKCKKIFIVTDDNVASLYLEKISQNLKNSGFDVNSFVFPHGEESKRLTTIEQIYTALVDFSMTRNDMLIALGGGVAGDMTGFAAASYMRGIDYIQIPTSLLSMVDSSIGGKTGVDLPQGKNLVGAIYQPLAIITDPEFLKTLPKKYYTDGLCEIIKYGYISDSSILNNPKDISVIEKCIKIKSDIVTKDERESGLRMLLNFGHTLGHAIEKCMNFSGIGHGEAVCKGMYISLKLGEYLGITEKGQSENYLSLCSSLDINPYTDIPASSLFDAVSGDKKKQDSFINFIFVSTPGNPVIKKIELTELKEAYIKVFGDKNE